MEIPQRTSTVPSKNVHPHNESDTVVDSIKIDVSLVPDHVRDDLAAATLGFVRGILQQPGGREMLDAKIAARKAKQRLS